MGTNTGKDIFTRLSHKTYEMGSIILEPTHIETKNNPDKAPLFNVFNEQGFVIVRLEDIEPNRDAVLWLSDWLTLGEPFIPPYLRDSNNAVDTKDGIIKVSISGSENAEHRAFSTSKESPIHTDGTAEPIGTVRTTIVLCEQTSLEGGKSTFFNASGALRELFDQNPNAAKSLFNDAALTRTTRDVLPQKTHTGPVFAVLDDGELVSRFSVDFHVSTWNTDKVPHLQEAMDFMLQACSPGSKWYTETALERREAVIMQNSKISHGRTDYKNAPNHHRVMWRGLYTQDLADPSTETIELDR